MCAHEKIGFATGIRIFRTQRNGRQSQLVVNDDGNVTYYVENFGWRLTRDGSGERNRTMSASEAKSVWPSYAKAIDDAVGLSSGDLRFRTTHPSLIASPRIAPRERWSLTRLSTWSFRGRRVDEATFPASRACPGSR
jgi:hypothetical protein